jgi:putative ABC transport system permease protein
MMSLRSGLRPAGRRLRIRFLPVPSQALGLAVLVAVLAATLVSAPLMIASAKQAAWEQQERRLSPQELGTVVLSSTFTGDGTSPGKRIAGLRELDGDVRSAATDAGLRRPQLLMQPPDTLDALTPAGTEPTWLVNQTGAEDHLDLVDGRATADGVLIPQSLATAAGVRAGGTLLLRADNHATVRLAVSGIYVLPTEPMPAYWSAHSYLFLPRFEPGASDPSPPPPAIIAPKDVALAAYAVAREDVYLEWFFPPRTGLTVDEARRTADRIAEFQLRLTDPSAAVARLVTGLNYSDLLTRTRLPEGLRTVDRTAALVAPPVRAVGLGGGAAALVLVGAWAGLRMRRRQDEMRSLVARGLSPARGALDAAREALLPVLVGLAAGGVVGWLLVRQLGPAEAVQVDPTEAGYVLLAGGLGVLVTVAAITAALVTRLDSVGKGAAAHLLGRVPWLAVTAAVAVLTAVPLVTGTANDVGGRIGVLPLLLPLLVTVVAAGAVTALLPRVGAAANGRLRRLSPAGFLALRRVLAGQSTSRLVVVTTALALGLVVYAGALGDSTQRTVAAKASVATGSDVVVPLARTSPSDGRLPTGAMVVGTVRGVAVVPSRARADVLVVHPEQVAGVVRWNDGFADQSLDDLMARLADYRGDRVPVIVAGSLPDPVTAATDGKPALDLTDYTLPIEIVGQVRAFPGQNSRDPLLVADWNRYGAALEATSRVPELTLAREVWARGEAAAVVDALPVAGYEPSSTDQPRTAADFAARPELDAQTWSLGYLRAVALAGGFLGLVGVAMHALSQQRRRTVAALLLGRMGMSTRSADAATAIEIGLLTGLAAVVAVAVALPSSALILRLLDPVPQLRPDPLFAVPWGSLGAVAAGVLVVTLGGAALVGRASRRATGGQVMRDAT